MKAIFVCWGLLAIGWSWRSARAQEAASPQPDGGNPQAVEHADRDASERMKSLQELALETEDRLSLAPRLAMGFDWTPTYHNLDGADSVGFDLLLGLPFRLAGNVYNLIQVNVPLIVDPVEGDAGFSNVIATDVLLFATGWGEWGVGMDVGFPTVTGGAHGANVWSLGPAAGATLVTSTWELGGYAQTFFSVGAEGDEPSLAELRVAPQLTYATPRGWIFGSSPMVYRYDLDDGRLREAPFGGRVGKVLIVGRVPVSLSIYGEYNLAQVTFGPSWTSGVSLAMLFDRVR